MLKKKRISFFCFAQTDSDGEEKAGDSSRETLDQSCEHAREQLTNSIRQQWRKLRNHMEKLDSQGTRNTVTYSKMLENDCGSFKVLEIKSLKLDD